MALMMKKKKAEKVKPKIRWWKLKDTSCQEAFRQEVARVLGGEDGLPNEWDKTVEMLRKTAETVLGVTFGKPKGDRKTWWNEKVQENTKENRGKESMGQNNSKAKKAVAWRRDVRMTICMLDWKQKKVRRSCTD